MTSPPLLDERPVALIFRSALFNPSETFIQAQAAGLRRYQPLVAGLVDKGSAVPELAAQLVVATPAERLLLQFGSAAALARRLAPYRPRLVHAHFATDGLLALPLARALGVPLVTSLRGYDVHRSRGALLRSGRLSWMRYAIGRDRLINEGQLFLAVSDALRDHAIALGFPPSRTSTHYNGVDLERFAPALDPPSGRMILHVGRLVEKKGTVVLIEAFSRVAAEFPDATLVVAGEGPLRARLERHASPLVERVQFLGAVSRERIAELMHRAWLLAAPSVTASDGDAEGLPNVVVEAAASGVPVVATAHSGIPEAVDNGVSGLIVPENDPEALAAALRRLLSSAELRRAHSKAARSIAEARFDLRGQSERLEDIYDRVCGA
jgi:glycosyltransferase involved in cell wall biosynthesis